jgi:chromosome segregation ATPase
MTPGSPPSSRSARIEDAIARLRSSLNLLEAAAARRAEADRSKSTLETELALMQDDRARLAVELDSALARANRLDTTTDELSRRIERAIGSVRSVIEAADRPR